MLKWTVGWTCLHWGIQSCEKGRGGAPGAKVIDTPNAKPLELARTSLILGLGAIPFARPPALCTQLKLLINLTANIHTSLEAQPCALLL